MPAQVFDAIRVLRIGPTTVPIRILPGDKAAITMEGGGINAVKIGETLTVRQGSGFTATSTAGRVRGVSVSATVEGGGSRGSASATISGGAASAPSGAGVDMEDRSQNGQEPSTLTIYVPVGTAIEVKNHVNGKFQVGAVKGPLVIDQMVNAHVAVDGVTDVNIKMLVNCHGYIRATGEVTSGMTVNCDIRIA